MLLCGIRSWGYRYSPEQIAKWSIDRSRCEYEGCDGVAVGFEDCPGYVVPARPKELVPWRYVCEEHARMLDLGSLCG